MVSAAVSGSSTRLGSSGRSGLEPGTRRVTGTCWSRWVWWQVGWCNYTGGSGSWGLAGQLEVL